MNKEQGILIGVLINFLVLYSLFLVQYSFRVLNVKCFWLR